MLEATQTASGDIVFEQSKRWEGKVVDGKYPLRQYIGGSDHSAVFLTEIPGEIPKQAAIKLIAADEGSADVQLGRLQLAAKLSHPHLLQTFDIGRWQLEHHQLLFVAMEYADETLSQILPQRPLTREETHALLTPTLEGLTFIHNNGFAHGHLQPANILVAGEQLKLSSDRLCRSGNPVPGKRTAYDAPETSNEGFTPAGDVWSLGMTLSEALTQRLPTWTDRLQGEPMLPTRMPEPFAEIARQCVVRDPRSRWKITEIVARLNAPGRSAAVRESSLEINEQSKVKPVAEPWKQQQAISNKWLYAIPIAAMIGIILLLAALPHRGPSQQRKSAANTASPQALPRTSARPQASTATPETDASNQVVRQVVPDVPQKALRTIRGKLKVSVRAHVDGRGNVERAEFTSTGPSRYFANLAMQSAQEWTFASTQTPKTWLLQFTFTRNGVTVQPRQIG